MDSHLKVGNPNFMAAILLVGTFIGLFGETALNMALTNIMDDFSVSASIGQCLTTGYLLVLAFLVPLSSYLVRWVTARQLGSGGLIVSIVGALIAAIAPSFSGLLIGRLIQAIGTGVF